jgi:hypothetical protein
VSVLVVSVVLWFISGPEGAEVEKMVVKGNCLVGKVGHSCGSGVQEGQLSLDIQMEAVIKLVDIKVVVIV